MTSDLSTEDNENRSLTSRILHHPIGRIVIQASLFMGILVLFKAAIIKPGLAAAGFEGDSFRALQGIITIAAMFAVYWGLGRFYERRKLHELPLLTLIPDGIAGITLGIAMISLIFLALWALGAYHITGVGSIAAMTVPVIWVILMAAMEELIFRGLLYRILEEWLGTLMALLLSASLFGFMHISNDNADMISVLSATSGGLLMCACYSLTGRLWLPIFFHASWNLTQAIYGSQVSGMEFFGTYFDGVREGPEWLTGGPFGVENSYVTLGLIFVVLAGLFWRMKHKGLFLSRRARAL